jgi:hypothetical protein
MQGLRSFTRRTHRQKGAHDGAAPRPDRSHSGRQPPFGCRAALLALAREREPSIDRATVYRTIELLKKFRLVDDLDLMHLEGEKHYYEVKTRQDHLHLACMGCQADRFHHSRGAAGSGRILQGVRGHDRANPIGSIE